MGVVAPDVLTADVDGSDGAARVDVEKGAGGEGAGAGCVAEGAMLGAGDAVDAGVNHEVGGTGVETAVYASGSGAVRPVRPNYCPWC